VGLCLGQVERVADIGGPLSLHVELRDVARKLRARSLVGPDG
jgi:hypothetical protein